ncbi:hypothetical protein [Bradyrhizobium sp. NAS96.2]|uniref:hypothetical protein n=1 Tax=Bradyrhizobium sp. NAS96.2 TaxID=1680160 RepID=UPI0011613BF4|nr:hypothetical protein [Bradyrhizobium sp. NAS96.2]
MAEDSWQSGRVLNPKSDSSMLLAMASPRRTLGGVNLLEPEQQAAPPGGLTEPAVPILKYWAAWKLTQAPRDLASGN